MQKLNDEKIMGALLAAGSSLAVGINPANLLTIGVLGIGGYGLLYGIVMYHSM